MTNLPKCSVEGCLNTVSRVGFKLCLEHWKQDNKMPKEDKIKSGENDNPKNTELLTSTVLGEHLGVNSRKVNQILSELGWVERSRKGWIPTEQGKKLNAESRENRQSGIPFVMWPKSILSSKILINSMQELMGAKQADTNQKVDENGTADAEEKTVGLREKLDKFKPSHRAMDGHWVRSKAEALIDNWLYMSSVVHAYERLLPVEEELYCDFYIPAGKVYIEYWGIENDPKYKERKEKKKEIYKKYGFNLIELNDEHIQNLDDYLPKMLLKFNVEID